MPTIDLKDITGGFRISDINSNFAKIEEAINDKVLKYDSTQDASSNNMESDLDMNTLRIINLDDAVDDTDAVNLRVLKDYVRLGITIQRVEIVLTGGLTELATMVSYDELYSATIYIDQVKQNLGSGYTLTNDGGLGTIHFTEATEAGSILSWEYYGA